ncbi:hypothetical protein LQV05_002611 [Cryptococcus neoformans]|nr:hypothetical protein LQV05_002611 [Cryptococcus neoformans]
MPRQSAHTQGSVPRKALNSTRSRQPSSARHMKIVREGPGGSITIKGKKAKEMQEETRKKAARAKEMETAAMEAELEKERLNITDKLRMHEEQEREWLAGDDNGYANSPCVYEEVDTSGWESEDCDDVPQDSYIKRSRTGQSSRPTFVYVKRIHKASYQRLMTNKHDNWAAVRDLMFLSYVRYEEESKGFQTPAFGTDALDLHKCICTGARNYSREITLVSLDKQVKQSVSFCLSCAAAEPVRLLQMGFVAASPRVPTIAFSLSLLQFLHTLWKVSPLGIDAVSKALWAYHGQRGGVYLADKSLKERRPGPLVRSALGVYRDIQFQKEMLLEQALDLSLRDVHASLCPACFGPRESSDLPDATKEVYMAVDANFTHSRLKSSANHVSHAAEQYEESGADKVKVGRDSSACSDNWKAKDGGQKEDNYKTDTGFVAIVCRHNCCHKMVNLYQTGEKMFYPLALIQYILFDVDPDVRVGLLYDIGCNFESHLRHRKFLAEELDDRVNDVRRRLAIGVAVFHAYAHDWLCQLRYHPRLIPGFGLSDGEGGGALLVCIGSPCPTQYRRRDLVSWIRTRLKKTQIRLLESVRVLEEVGKKGWSETKLASEWSDQKKTQEDQGEIEASVERRKKYEKLGELLGLWDRVKDISKELKTNVAPGSEKLKIAEKLLENLNSKEKEYGGDIEKLARELTNGKISAEELKYLCKLHAAKCALRRERDIQLSASRPKKETKLGMRPSVGQRLLQRIEKGANGRSIHQNAAVRAFNAAVLDYTAFLARTPQSSTPNTRKAPPMLKCWKDVTKMNDDDVFWTDVVWLTLSERRITALLDRDRCREELTILQVELARLIRWSDKTFKTLQSSIQDWEEKVIEQIKWDEEYMKALDEGDVERRKELNMAEPTKTLDVFKGVVYLLKKRLEEHRQLEQRWVADGLSVLWNTYMITEKFKQDQVLQRQYQDLYQRALAADHEPQYEDTSPASPDSDVERDDVSWYDSDSADEEGEEEDAEDGQQSGQTVLEGPTTLETLMEID